MKWNKEQEQQLRDLCFREKSNKEIATIMGIELSDVHGGRSRFGVTVAKVAAAKASTKEVQAVDQKVKRWGYEVLKEIMKVEMALDTAKKKIVKCENRLEILREELKTAK